MRKNILETIREEVKDLYDAGLIDETTMRKFDANVLEPTRAISQQDVKKIRSKVRVSQPVFASYLNVSPAAVKQWENGERKPGGASARLLQLIKYRGLEIFDPIIRESPIKIISKNKSKKESSEEKKVQGFK